MSTFFWDDILKNLFLMTTVFLLISCHPSQKEEMRVVDDGSGIELPLNGDVPYEAYRFDTNLNLINFSAEQEVKIHQASRLLKDVIQTKEFKDAILNYTYKGKKQFFDNAGFTNTQIYQKILNAAEILTPAKNNQLDAEIELYYNSQNTIGYTYPNSTRIWINTKYFEQFTPVEVAGNILHEWLHKLGFNHSVSWNEDRDHTVPYAIGYLLERIAKDILQTY